MKAGREWSSYPDRCVLKYERRTVPGESDSLVEGELNAILTKLRQSDSRFEAQGRSACLDVCLRRSIVASRARDFLRYSAYSACRNRLRGERLRFGPTLPYCPRPVFRLQFSARAAKGSTRFEEYVVADDVVACAEVIYRFAMGGESGLKHELRENSPLKNLLPRRGGAKVKS